MYMYMLFIHHHWFLVAYPLFQIRLYNMQYCICANAWLCYWIENDRKVNKLLWNCNTLPTEKFCHLTWSLHTILAYCCKHCIPLCPYDHIAAVLLNFSFHCDCFTSVLVSVNVLLWQVLILARWIVRSLACWVAGFDTLLPVCRVVSSWLFLASNYARRRLMLFSLVA
jgi:hypothetical protein